MVFVRYPWKLWGLGNVSKRFMTVFFRRLRDLCPSGSILKPFRRPTESKNLTRKCWKISKLNFTKQNLIVCPRFFRRLRSEVPVL